MRRQTEAGQAYLRANQPPGEHSHGSDHIYAAVAHVDEQRPGRVDSVSGAYSPLPLAVHFLDTHFVGRREHGFDQEDDGAGRHEKAAPAQEHDDI